MIMPYQSGLIVVHLESPQHIGVKIDRHDVFLLHLTSDNAMSRHVLYKTSLHEAKHD